MSGTLFLLVSVIAFAVTAALGKWMIPFLHKLKFGQTIREVGPSWHKSKQGTPTMGGLMFILGIAVAMMGCLPVFYSLGMEETLLMKVKVFAGLGMAVAFGAIGFMDDYIGIVKKRNLGLTERQKLVLQFAVAAAYLVSVALAGGNTATTIPFVGKIDLWWFYYPLAAIVIVGVPAHQQEHQQEHGDAENHHGQLVEVVVIKGGNDQHGRHPKHGKGSLPGDEEIAVAVVIIAVSVAGREEHDQPNGQQHQNENQQGHIQPCAQAEELIPDGPAFAFPLLGGRLPLGSAGRPVTGHPAQAAGSPSHCSHRDSSFLRSFSAAVPSL